MVSATPGSLHSWISLSGRKEEINSRNSFGGPLRARSTRRRKYSSQLSICIIVEVPSLELLLHQSGFILSQIENLKEKFLKLDFPWISTIPLEKGWRWIPTWKSLPNSDKSVLGVKAESNVFSSLKYEIASFAHNIHLIHSMEVLCESWYNVKRTLWPLYIAYNTKAANEDLDYYEKWVGPIFASVATAFEGEFLHDGKRKIAHLRPGKSPMLDS